MSDKVPFFLSGGNAKILMNNKVVAFATDVSYKVSIKHASPRVLGRFEVEVHQPVAYDVAGSLTIIRYARGVKEFLRSNGKQSPDSVSNKGNGLGSFSNSPLGAVGAALGLGTLTGTADGKTNEALVPARMFQSSSFDLEIRQKLPNGEAKVILLRGCRIEDSDFRLNRRGVATQTLTFKAQYADDDTAVARKSGVGQELS
jgi:hypothetical protein